MMSRRFTGMRTSSSRCFKGAMAMDGRALNAKLPFGNCPSRLRGVRISPSPKIAISVERSLAMTGLIAITRIKPKGTRHVAHTRLMEGHDPLSWRSSSSSRTSHLEHAPAVDTRQVQAPKEDGMAVTFQRNATIVLK